MFTRSNFAITRLIVLPFGALLALYLLVVLGGGTWLYLQVRAVETQLLIEEVKTVLEPLTEKLRRTDLSTVVRQRETWLIEQVQPLFADIPSLRKVSLRARDAGIELILDDGKVAARDSVPLPVGSRLKKTASPAVQRLHSEFGTRFLIGFDLTRDPATFVRLEFSFDRATLLTRVHEGTDTVQHAITGFATVGAVSILFAAVITVAAMRVTRNMEVHFQEIYHRASMTEMASALVHDLRNPLAALRANVKALLVAPEQMSEIVEELDRDIVSLNDKLTAFLNLTRCHDDGLESADISELIKDAVRLAAPVLFKHGLGIETDMQPDLPTVTVRKASVRDALLNVLFNAGESGQKAGAIRITVSADGDAVRIVIEDRGRGVSKQHLPRLFDPFYTTRQDGSGLGLAIVQRIVDAHQGQVHVENRPQGGVRVVLSLPLHPKETPAWWNKQKRRFPA